MIIRKGDFFITKDSIFISDDCINTDTEVCYVFCKKFKDDVYRRIYSKDIEKVISKEENPEYFL